MAELTPDRSPVGRVLLSYATLAWEALERGEGILGRHPVAWHNYQVARAFLDLGFSVDVIWHSDARFRPRHSYDIMFDVAYALDRLHSVIGDGPLRIYYPDFAHWTKHNSRSLARVAALRERRGVVLRPKRIAPVQDAAETAQHLLCRGGSWSRGTYDHVPAPIHRLDAMTGPLLPEPPERKDDVRHRFIWLSGGGMTHKGLDLVLEAFARNPHLELDVFGDVQREEAFCEAYSHELNELPNIRLMGWINPASPEFAAAASRAVAIVHPSASEMCCTAVIAGMAAGLVPVATRSTDIELEGLGIEVQGDSVDAVEQALLTVAEKPRDEVEALSRAARNASMTHYGRDKFIASFRKVLPEILGVSPSPDWARPWNPDDDPRVPNIRICKAPS